MMSAPVEAFAFYIPVVAVDLPTAIVQHLLAISTAK